MAKTRRELELEIKSLEILKQRQGITREELATLDKQIIRVEKLLDRQKTFEDLKRSGERIEKQALKDAQNNRLKNLRTAGLDVNLSRAALDLIRNNVNKSLTLGKQKEKLLTTVDKLQKVEQGVTKSVIDQTDEVKTAAELRQGIDEKALAALQEFLNESEDLKKISLDQLLEDLAKFSKNSKKGLGDFTDLGKGFADELGDLFKVGGLVGFGAILAQQFIEFGKNIQANRRELGLTVLEATRLSGQSQILGIRAKEFGLGVEDVRKIQASILENLGGQAKLTNELVNDFLVLEGTLGVTADTASKLLPILDSVGAAGERGAVAQIESLGALIRLEGLSPGQILGDVASNTEFFAKFAKDGGTNLIRAAISARKLGLELSAVNSITESLLDFETSIEKQLEASLLLGRQINLDRARQLALTGDQEGLLEEVRRQIGDEAEFTRLNVVQRQALADAFGLQVEQVARAVRGNTAAVTGAAAAGGGDELQRKMVNQLGDVVRNTGVLAKAI